MALWAPIENSGLSGTEWVSFCSNLQGPKEGRAQDEWEEEVTHRKLKVERIVLFSSPLHIVLIISIIIIFTAHRHG